MDWNKIIGIMSWPEWFGAITGLLCVWLTVKNYISNWFWGILSVIAYGYVFWQSSLYSNAALQILFFLPMQFYGWWTWKKGGEQDNSLPVTYAGTRTLTVLLVIAAAFTGVWGYILSNGLGLPQPAAYPYVDAGTTGISIASQYLQARKQIESWWLWIAVDMIYAFFLFPAQKLWPTTGLYVIFLGLAVMGLLEWQKLMRQQTVVVVDKETAT